MKSFRFIFATVIAIMGALAFAAPVDSDSNVPIRVKSSAPIRAITTQAITDDMGSVASDGMETTLSLEDDSSATIISHSKARRRDIDRLQPDRNQPINFDLLPRCYHDCFAKFNLKGRGTYNIFEVSVKNFCDYPHGALWNDWFTHGPNFCLIEKGRCTEDEKAAGRDWYKKNCRR
jgi:hypothetical protein